MTATSETLHKFVAFCQQHITGDEKGQAQIFLDRFFQAFGRERALEAGATSEQKVQKERKKGKTGFADLVWKLRVLIEMKKRGKTFGKYYSQAFDYWARLVSDRSRYVILCNFDKKSHKLEPLRKNCIDIAANKWKRSSGASLNYITSFSTSPQANSRKFTSA